MITLPHNYEVRLQCADGRLSILMFVQAATDGDAKAQALDMMRGNLTHATVWRDGALVDWLHQPDENFAPGRDRSLAGYYRLCAADLFKRADTAIYPAARALCLERANHWAQLAQRFDTLECSTEQ